MASNSLHIESFDLRPGTRLADKYVVGNLLGKGWEGEVYHVKEITTGVERAAKFFFPNRNVNNKSIKFYAQKLDKLRKCDMVIHYHTQETMKFDGEKVRFLVSEYVEGRLLTQFIENRPHKRLHYFEGLHLLRAMAVGIEQIHNAGEYHGDLHSDNIIVQRAGLGFDLKILDMYPWGRRTREHVIDDIASVIRIFYDAIGGQKFYKDQPPAVKYIVSGLKRSLIRQKFRTAAKLRHHLDTLSWD